MASRESADTTSSTGVKYVAPSATAQPSVKNIKYTLIGTHPTIAFNGHSVEVWSDNAVFDTVSNVYLYPGKDYNPGDLQKR